MKSGGFVTKCIHKSKKLLFAKRAGFIAYPLKTDEWLSANDLAKDKDFPNSNRENINDALDKFEYDPDFEGFILDMKCSGLVTKCLHVSKKLLFAKRAGFRTYPPKTDEWLSASDLIKDKDFPSGHIRYIYDALDKFEHDPDFEGFILNMKTRSKVTKCIHVSKKQLLAERAGFKYYPPKTDEWLSANDLAKDKDFPRNDASTTNKLLDELRHDPDFEGFILEMKNGSMVSRCVHKSKKQALIDKAWAGRKRKKWQSLQDGTKVVGAMSAVQDIENSTKPDDQHKM